MPGELATPDHVESLLAHCRTCHASIVWTITRTGRRMPVDATPHDEGNVELRTDVISPTTLHAAVLGPIEAAVATTPLYRSHFATCPQADRHRRRS